MGGVEHWLAAGQFSWRSAGTNGALLQLAGPGHFATALAAEISRFSCAAYESMLDSAPATLAPRSLAWPMVRHYYAVFYCAHALLRAGGRSITFLSSATVAKLNQLAGQYLGVSPQLTGGAYCVSYQAASGDVDVAKLSGAAGGSHEEMWKEFLALLREIENILLTLGASNATAKVASDLCAALRASLTSQGKVNGAWLSAVRNSLNYRQEHGVWFPYSRKKSACDALTARLLQWHSQPAGGLAISTTKDDLVRAADMCNVVSHLLTATLSDLARRAPAKGKSFVDRAPFRLLRGRGVPV